MAIKYKKSHGLRDAITERHAPFHALAPKPRVTQRTRLIMIYVGILFFCAFLLIGELFMRSQRAAHDAPRQARGTVSAITLPDTPGDNGSMVIELDLGASGIQSIAADLPESHLRNLRQGDTVAVVYQKDAESNTLKALDVSLFALDPAAPLQ